jgi:ABC-2 type transport system ATP-binding protein
MMQLLEARAAEGTAVLLSSHILEEIEGVASRILVMIAGRLAASGDHRTLRRLMTDRPHSVRIRASNVRALAAQLVVQAPVVSVEVDGADALNVRTTDYTAFSRLLVQSARGAAVTLYDVQPTDESLEHVFAYLVQR